MAAEQQFEKLLENFLEKLPDRIRQIRLAVVEIYHDRDSRSKLDSFKILLHKLQGAFSALGFSELSDVTNRYEKFIDLCIKKCTPLSDADADMIERLFEELDTNSKYPDTKSALKILLSTQLGYVPVKQQNNAAKKQQLYLLCTQPESRENMGSQLELYGYNVKTIDSPAEVPVLTGSDYHTNLVMHTHDLSRHFPDDKKLGEFRKQHEKKTNIVFISSNDTFETRLSCAKAGGKTFFPDSTETVYIAETIESMHENDADLPISVLIIDDDEDQASYYAFMLEQAGMITTILTDPHLALETIHSANPEIILMDMYMPGCDGIQLAGIIRMDRYASRLPIVFLSVEKDIETQLSAINNGGDAFLTKPITKHHLATSVSNRAEAARQKYKEYRSDPLTRVLNHVGFVQLIQKCNRHNHNKSKVFAAIQVIDLHAINSEQTCEAGDRVLKSLSIFLRKNTGSYDYIGRIDGDTFGILFSQPPDDLDSFLDDLSHKFNKIRHHGQKGSFHAKYRFSIYKDTSYETIRLICSKPL